MDIQGVLSQIRTIREQTSAVNLPRIDVGSAVKQNGNVTALQESGFGAAMADALQNVNSTQKETARLQQAFELGDPSADLATVMVAMQKSKIAFTATVEVRNRLVSAYQEIMSMPI